MKRMGRPKKSATTAKTVQMSLRMEISLRSELEAIAVRDGLDLADVMRAALRDYLKTRKAA